MVFLSPFIRLILISICLLLIPNLSSATSSDLEIITSDNITSITEILNLDHSFDGLIADATWTNDGQTLAVSGELGIVLYNMDDPENPVQITTSTAADLLNVDSDPDRLFGAVTESGYVRLWEIGRESEATRLSHRNAFELAFSHDGRLLATGSGDGTIMIWRTDSFELITSLDTGYDNAIKDLEFSPTEDLLVAVTLYEGVLLYNITSDDDLSNIVVDAHIIEQFNGSRAAISPDGSSLAIGFWDSSRTEDTIIIWDIETRTPIETLSGHVELTRALVFSPDGRVLVSTGDDDVVRIWNVETYQEIINIPVENPIKILAFSPDQRRIAIVGYDGFVRIWAIPSQED